MTRPNLFIVGAPKCGTTALSEYLRGHPQVFLCDPKEPRYFAEDMDQHRYVRTLEDYLALFKAARPQHSVVGEASVDYLYSSVALAHIRAFAPDARIVAMVRNPIDMAASLHRQLLFTGYENEPDFVRAWQLQAGRRAGRDIPAGCRAPMYLQYAEACRLGVQVQRLLATFPREQVKLIVFDDFAANPRAVYRDLLAFLGLPDDGRDSFERINEAKQPRSAWLGRLIARGKPGAVALALRLRATTGCNLLPLMKRASSINETKADKRALPPGLRRELAETFRDDVRLLSELLGRNFDHWLNGHD